jgi:hypothetical protein
MEIPPKQKRVYHDCTQLRMESPIPLMKGSNTKTGCMNTVLKGCDFNRAERTQKSEGLAREVRHQATGAD